jgi:hypothetical protein
MQNLRRPRRSPTPAPVAPAAVIPGAGAREWELCRPAALPGGAWSRQTLPTLEAAAMGPLAPGDPFVLALPLDAGLVQRLALPPAEPSELEEMARIQLEKILPYPTEDVGMSFQVIERRETEVILSVQAVHHDRLLAICQPLTSRGCWPTRVVFHAASLAAGASEGEISVLVYQEAGQIILALCEGGRLNFAQSLGSADQPPERVASELPTVLLGAELEGVSVAFTAARLDERCANMHTALEETLRVPVRRFTPEPNPVDGDNDLSPMHWREERLRSVRAARLKRRLWLGAGIYAGGMLLAFCALAVLKYRVSKLDARLRKEAPVQEFVRASEAKWKTLAPATQPSRFLAETLMQVYECLPPGNKVILTNFELTPTSIVVEGEASSPDVAVDFTEKLKASSELKAAYRFGPSPPAILTNGRAKFSVAGKTP